jgi:hypothetical protein
MAKRFPLPLIITGVIFVFGNLSIGDSRGFAFAYI